MLLYEQLPKLGSTKMNHLQVQSLMESWHSWSVQLDREGNTRCHAAIVTASFLYSKPLHLEPLSPVVPSCRHANQKREGDICRLAGGHCSFQSAIQSVSLSESGYPEGCLYWGWTPSQCLLSSSSSHRHHRRREYQYHHTRYNALPGQSTFTKFSNSTFVTASSS